MVRVVRDGVRLRALAHRLVWFHRNGVIPVDLQINHRNGDGKDNLPSNLELVTPSENMIHAAHVLKTARAANQSGEQNAGAKLTWTEVREIRLRSGRASCSGRSQQTMTYPNRRSARWRAERSGIAPRPN